MNYYIEEYDQKKHLHLLSLMRLSPESALETQVSPLHALGLGQLDILYDCVLGSPLTFIVRCRDTRRIRGVFGCSQSFREGGSIAIPWFLSDGFEREPVNLRAFLMDSKRIISNWRRTSKCKRMENYCLNDKRITRWLSYLGFTVSSVVTTIQRIPMRQFWWGK